MKQYFKRLKSHPGLLPAFVMTILCFIAALGNQNIGLVNALILGGIFSGLFWVIVLISNFN